MRKLFVRLWCCRLRLIKKNYKNSKKSGKETVTTDDKNNVELFLME